MVGASRSCATRYRGAGACRKCWSSDAPRNSLRHLWKHCAAQKAYVGCSEASQTVVPTDITGTACNMHGVRHVTEQAKQERWAGSEPAQMEAGRCQVEGKLKRSTATSTIVRGPHATACAAQSQCDICAQRDEAEGRGAPYGILGASQRLSGHLVTLPAMRRKWSLSSGQLATDRRVCDRAAQQTVVYLVPARCASGGAHKFALLQARRHGRHPCAPCRPDRTASPLLPPSSHREKKSGEICSNGDFLERSAN